MAPRRAYASWGVLLIAPVARRLKGLVKCPDQQVTEERLGVTAESLQESREEAGNRFSGRQGSKRKESTQEAIIGSASATGGGNSSHLAKLPDYQAGAKELAECCVQELASGEPPVVAYSLRLMNEKEAAYDELSRRQRLLEFHTRPSLR